MSIEQYEAFIKILETGSLTRAADELGYTQSGITYMLNTLEEQLGFKLLYRNRSGVRLTGEGKQMLPYIQAVLSQQHILAERASEISGLSAGLIRIGTFTSVSSHWLPGIIRSYQDEYPNIRFELYHGTNEENESWAYTGKVDLSFVKLPTDKNLDTVFLENDPIVLVVPKESKYSEYKTMPLEQLPELPYISLNEGVDDEITEILSKNNIKMDTRFVERDDYAVLAMIEQGLGVSIMPQLVTEGSNRDIAIVPLDPPACRDLGLAYRNNNLLSSASKEFIRHAIAFIQE